LLLLLNNPEKLRKLEKEIIEVFPTGSEAITFGNTQEMVYLNAVISETERRMPVMQGGRFPEVKSTQA